MEKIKLPELPEVVVKGVVSVKSSDLKVLVDAYNTAAATLVAQQTFIKDLTDRHEALVKAYGETAELVKVQQETIVRVSAEVKACREDITKIAKILEELYET